MGKKTKLKKLRQILKIVSIHRLIKRRQRSIHIRQIFQNRKITGEMFLVHELASDPLYHHKYFRMTRDNFEEILGIVKDDITRNPFHSHPISALEKLSLTLRFLASGNSQLSLAMSYRISPSSVGIIIRETVESICALMGPIYLPDPDEQTWKRSEVGFSSKWNFPNAIGAVDGKHIRIQAPPSTVSTHYNYKHYFSVVLMAVADADYKFSFASIGAAGSQSDGGVFSRSPLGKKLYTDTLPLPLPKLVGTTVLPHVFLGDDAFQLRKNLMKPFPGQFLTMPNRIFNYRLSRGRMVVENSFGILSARWRILHTRIIADLALTKKIVKACVILHNFLLSKHDLNCLAPDVDNNGKITPGNWREHGILRSCSTQGANNYTGSAKGVREGFKNYFNNEGAVDWQLACVQ